MLRWTVRTLVTAIASVMVVWACVTAAGAVATGTGSGAVVPRPEGPAPVVVPSPELVGVPSRTPASWTTASPVAQALRSE